MSSELSRAAKEDILKDGFTRISAPTQLAIMASLHRPKSVVWVTDNRGCSERCVKGSAGGYEQYKLGEVSRRASYVRFPFVLRRASFEFCR